MFRLRAYLCDLIVWQSQPAGRKIISLRGESASAPNLPTAAHFCCYSVHRLAMPGCRRLPRLQSRPRSPIFLVNPQPAGSLHSSLGTSRFLRDRILAPVSRCCFHLDTPTTASFISSAAVNTSCAQYARLFTFRDCDGRFSYRSKAASIPRSTASKGMPASFQVSIKAQSKVESNRMPARRR